MQAVCESAGSENGGVIATGVQPEEEPACIAQDTSAGPVKFPPRQWLVFQDQIDPTANRSQQSKNCVI